MAPLDLWACGCTFGKPAPGENIADSRYEPLAQPLIWVWCFRFRGCGDRQCQLLLYAPMMTWVPTITLAQSRKGDLRSDSEVSLRAEESPSKHIMTWHLHCYASLVLTMSRPW